MESSKELDVTSLIDLLSKLKKRKVKISAIISKPLENFYKGPV